MRSIAFAALCLSHLALAGEHQFRCASLFTDNMVFQQRISAPVWGTGTPGASVTVRASWNSRSRATVDGAGRWNLALGTPRAGGPFIVTVACGESTIVLRNVMVGEVWLCSGQSNMEMPLEGWPPDTVLRSAAEIAGSTYPLIRLFHVKRAYAPAPDSTCEGRWEECAPATSRSFSAAAYFFGRNLHAALRVPVGLIEATWGGTPAEAWTSGPSLGAMADFDSTLTKISAAREGLGRLRAWLARYPSVDVSTRAAETRWMNIDFRDEGCAAPAYPDSGWPVMRLPALWETTPMGEFDGTVWFRKRITIPPAWVHRDLRIELGPIDDMDVTYVNGREVGSHETEGFWKLERSYPVPAAIVDTTVLTIAVRVIDNGGGGGIYGNPQAMCVHPVGGEERVALAGDWKFLPVAEFRGSVFSVFGAKGEEYFHRPVLPLDFSPYTPTALYNGMIAPLVPYRIAGVIWYQGESNVARPAQYARLFPLMIADWRTAFRSAALPFCFVQIAPYEYGPGAASQLLRESQLGTLRVPRTAMAVTLDIGNPHNIHPANKQEVGRRLALLALAGVYGKALTASGPLLRSVKRYVDRIELRFAGAQGGLVVTQNEQGNGFTIAGPDSVFTPADVVALGDRLIVSGAGVKDPRAVRYAFTNTAQATLFNGKGLPASSFRTDSWDR
ncbi:MAG TPA: sialate O-acetylesterase [Bacteroidota bacterium]|nr:sialate O-acetylesterase [Bacteroidota bacterium]